MKVKILKCSKSSWWYSKFVGQIFETLPKDWDAESYGVKAPEGCDAGILKTDCEVVNEFPAKASPIDAHYSFDYTLPADMKKGDAIKIDPYFVARTWQLGKRDDSGILFHCLKTLARFGDKNSREREIVALYKQVVRLAQLEGVTLE